MTPREATALQSLRSSALRRRALETSLLTHLVAQNGEGYLAHRHVLVEWLVHVCRLLGLSQTTLHAGVAHVDRVMSLRPMSRKVWQLAAVAALLVAAKVEEAADAIPSVADLEYMCAGDFDAAYIRRMEVCLLDLLDWDAHAPTPVHFLRLFQAVAARVAREAAVPGSPVSPDDGARCAKRPRTTGVPDVESVESDDENVPPPTEEGVTAAPDDDVFGAARCALDLALYEPRLRARFGPALIAAAAWAAARHVCGRADAWTDRMGAISGVRGDDPRLRECVAELVGLFEHARDGTE